MKYKTGKCPECGGIYSTKKNGRLRAHGYSQSRWYASGPGCPGSNRLPVGVEAEE